MNDQKANRSLVLLIVFAGALTFTPKKNGTAKFIFSIATIIALLSYLKFNKY